MRLVIIGAPGSGKGTMAKMLAEHYNIPHISTGDLFRDNVKRKTDLGEKAETYMNKGELVPDDVTLGMLRQRLNDDDAETGFILDGFPRTINQAILLEQDFPLDKAILMDVSEKTMIDRITLRRTCQRCGMMFHLKNLPPKKTGICDICGGSLIQRDDEKEEVIKNRLQVYKKQSLPVVDHFDKKGILLRVDAEPSPDIVFANITTEISEK